MIPKIIHQTAPSDRDRWPSSWHLGRQSVLYHFPSSEYKHILWHDEDLENHIREHHGWFLEIYLSYPSPIYRVDAARYFILHDMGGIYLDMDMEVLQDFYSQLPAHSASVVESPFPNMEKVQNSLMASPPHHPFWIEVMRELSSPHTRLLFGSNVLDATGPRMLDRVMETGTTRTRTHVLPMRNFNPEPLDQVYNTTQWQSYPHEPCYTRHHASASWRD
jgi:mannosyltransferase OCH1-like enzyme